MSTMFDCTGCSTVEAQKRCKQLRKSYETLGRTDMLVVLILYCVILRISGSTWPYFFPQFSCCLSRRCKWIFWPGARSKSAASEEATFHSPLAAYKRHLNGSAKNDWSKISLVHWHPDVVESCFQMAKRCHFSLYITKELGDKVGLSTADEALHGSDVNLQYRVDHFYYNVPSMSLAKAEELESIRMSEMGITPSGTCGNASSEKKRHLSDASVLESDIKEQKKKEEILDVHVKFITSLSEYQLDHLNKLEKRRKQESEKMQQVPYVPFSRRKKASL